MRSLGFYLKEMFPHRPDVAVGREDDLIDDFEMSVKSSISKIHHKIVAAPYIVFSSIYHFGENVGCLLLSDHCWLLAHGCHLLVASLIVSHV